MHLDNPRPVADASPDTHSALSQAEGWVRCQLKRLMGPIDASRDLDDLVEEIILKVYRISGGLPPDARSPLVRRFLRYVFADWCRAQSRRRDIKEREQERVENSRDDRPEPIVGAVVAADLERTVNAVLMDLGPDDRTVLRLRFWDERSVDDIAETLNSTPSKIKTRIKKSLTKLKNLHPHLAELLERP